MIEQLRIGNARERTSDTILSDMPTLLTSNWAIASGGLVVFLLLWQIIVWIGDYPTFILPSPALVAVKFVTVLQNGLLWKHFQITLVETLLGFIVGFMSATTVGYWLAWHPLAERLVTPYIVAMQAVPVIAIAPLLVIWFGFGMLSKILVCALIVFFPILINTVAGLRSLQDEWLELMRSFNATRWQTFKKVELPGSLPVLFAGIKLGVTLSVIGAVVGEFAGAEAGLGALINIARGGLYDTPLLFVALFTLVAMALTLYGIVVLLERRYAMWHKRIQ